ncbi:hypothetical protein [Nostoc sp.]|uniref:hypothetical protein n=1 Tax=Nostoc sp. TaxID=1180 RepID=UPI003FA5B22B
MTLEESFDRFEVICLWEQPTSVFLEHPGLLPFAVLSQRNDHTAALQQVAEVISEISEEAMSTTGYAYAILSF